MAVTRPSKRARASRAAEIICRAIRVFDPYTGLLVSCETLLQGYEVTAECSMVQFRVSWIGVFPKRDGRSSRLLEMPFG